MGKKEAKKPAGRETKKPSKKLQLDDSEAESSKVGTSAKPGRSARIDSESSSSSSASSSSGSAESYTEYDRRSIDETSGNPGSDDEFKPKSKNGKGKGIEKKRKGSPKKKSTKSTEAGTAIGRTKNGTKKAKDVTPSDTSSRVTRSQTRSQGSENQTKGGGASRSTSTATEKTSRKGAGTRAKFDTSQLVQTKKGSGLRSPSVGSPSVTSPSSGKKPSKTAKKTIRKVKKATKKGKKSPNPDGYRTREPARDLAELDYGVVMHPIALAAIQIASHLTNNEIAGYLAGVVYELGEPRTQVVHILEAYPVNSLTPEQLQETGRNAESTVEMDPNSQLAVQDAIRRQGMLVLGWYHSHPIYSTDPSNIDIENHAIHQNAMPAGQPYIAAICSTNWIQLQDARARTDMFKTSPEYRGSRTVVQNPFDVPYLLTYDPPPRNTRGTSQMYARIGIIDVPNAIAEFSRYPLPTVDQDTHERLFRHLSARFETTVDLLRAHFARSIHRLDLNAEWNDGLTYGQKLSQSLHASLIMHPPGNMLATPHLSRVGQRNADRRATGNPVVLPQNLEERDHGDFPVDELAVQSANRLAVMVDNCVDRLVTEWTTVDVEGSRRNNP